MSYFVGVPLLSGTPTGTLWNALFLGHIHRLRPLNQVVIPAQIMVDMVYTFNGFSMLNN